MERLLSGFVKNLFTKTDIKFDSFRCLSSISGQSFKSSDLQIIECKPNERQTKPDWNQLVFGKTFTDHMFEVNWNSDKGWGKPKICPMHNFSLHPSSKVFHYAQELFEGLKAFRGKDGKIRIFRPDMNIKRMKSSAERMSLPDFEAKDILECMTKLVQIDADWVPPFETGASLYIRPTYIGTEAALGVHSSKDAILYIICGPAGNYFGKSVKPVSLLADPRFARAWPGGVGDKKVGANYGSTIALQQMAEKMGFNQMLWLFGPEHQITEVGVMNAFIFIINERGEKELITPTLKDGLILPGITRLSILQLAQSWNEFKVTEGRMTMKQLKQLVKEKRVLEMFGSGTACVVCPFGRIHYMNEDIILPTPSESESLQMRLFKSLRDIQYGNVSHEWSVVID